MTAPMTDALDDELRGLLAETNDQRRRAGQALYHFYRSLVFWQGKGRTFHAIAKAWSAGGEQIFDSQAAALQRLAPHRADLPLRAYVADVLAQLAGDLERGDHLLVPFLRWIEGRFPELTSMMQAETPDSRIHDYDLARALARMFGLCERADRAEMVRCLRETSAEIVAGRKGPKSAGE